MASESREKSEADGRAVTFDHQIGKVFANLQIGADVAGAKSLLANEKLATRGVMLFGSGFIVSQERARELGFGSDEFANHVIKHYRNGRDLLATSRGVMVIDLFGYNEQELRKQSPGIYQHVKDNVWPERSQNNRKWRRENWWLFGEPLSTFRPALEGLQRFIVTVETSKHRTFQFLDGQVMPDNKLVAFALEDAANLSVLSSYVHQCWCLAQGTVLEDRPVYPKTQCFDTFPFPDLTDPQRTHLRQLGEDLDAHRKRQQAAHPKLTLTQMYNVLEKLRAGEAIEGKDREIYDQGLIGILRDLHDQIDAAVADAYGWSVDLSDEEILLRLVALNKERAEEEARGHIRWLRPDYQNPTGAGAVSGKTSEMDLGAVTKVEKAAWPKALPDQIAAVREALSEMGEATPDQIARRFLRARSATVRPLLESLAALGQAEVMDSDRFAA